MAEQTLPFYQVQYQTAPPLLRGTVLRPLSVAEFTEACEMLLATARRHRCPYWLLDGRADANTRPPDLYEWLSDEFLPRVHRVLHRVPTLAFVARPDFWRELRAQNFAPPTVIAGTFRAGWFTDEASALAWLTTFRTMSPAPKA